MKVGFIGLGTMGAFMAANLPFLMKHNIEQPEDGEADKKADAA